MACSDGSVLHQWTLAGIGLAWRSLWEIQDDLAAGRLISVLDDYAAPANGIFAMLPERKHLPLRVRLFIEMLKTRYASPAYWSPAGEKPTLTSQLREENPAPVTFMNLKRKFYP